jgi:hypothetical protein
MASKDDLVAMVADVTAFLRDVEKVLPNRVDEELLKFLDGINSHPWLVDLLLGSITASKALDQRKGR